MVRRTDPKDDDWQHVTDARKRKQIQDRLAQRARRQRLREGKSTSKTQIGQFHNTLAPRRCNCDPSKHSSVDIHHHTLTFSTTSFNPADPSTYPTPTDPSYEIPYLDMHDLSAIDFPLPGFPTPYILSPQSQPAPRLTVVSALYLNGSILGLSCSVCITSCSPLPEPHHPAALRPTETQLQVEHPRWYDRLPFPRMRDGLIRWAGVLDEEDLLRDLFLGESWRIEGTGDAAAWNPGVWKVEARFAGKWGWLWA